MRRAAVLLAVTVAVAGCGGGRGDAPDDQVRKDVRERTRQVRERVKEAGGKPDAVDAALLEIERMDLPEDVKQELLEAKELLDKYAPE